MHTAAQRVFVISFRINVIFSRLMAVSGNAMDGELKHCFVK